MATKSKTLKVGDAVTVKDRLWAVVEANGRILPYTCGTPSIFSTRAGADKLCDEINNHGDGPRGGKLRTLRLRDIVGDVVR